MNMNMEDLQPYLTAIMQALVGLLAAAALGVIALFRSKLAAWLDARTTAAQRETLHKLAAEAAALAESAYESLDGPAKLNRAFGYLAARVGELGIDVKPESLRAAIEKAVLDYHAASKGAVADAGAQRG